MYRFFGVVDKVLALEDIQAKILGASQLAEMLWKHDDARSRQYFEQILTITDATSEPEKRELVRRLRQSVVVMIAKHDAAWAKRLIDSKQKTDGDDGPGDSAETNIEIASSLILDHPDAAVDFAGRSLRGGVDPSFIWFLKELRASHEREADQLFLQALGRSVQQPELNLNNFALLGTYLFTSPKALAADPGSVIITRVGNIGIVDITAERPGVSPALIRAYLSAAVAVLSRQSSDVYQRQTAYALGYLLLPKARLYAPDLIALISEAMSLLGAGIPPTATQESTFANLNKIRPDITEVMSNAEKNSDPESRDVAYLDAAFHAWLKQDFQSARIATGKISAEDAAISLTRLIDFGEGVSLLKQSAKLREAESFASKLPPGIERALLFLGVAQSAVRSGDQSKAIEANSLALQAAHSVNDVRRPFIILIAAGQLAALDAIAAHSALTDAIKEFNKYEDSAVRVVSWEQKVEIGPLVEKFPLRLDGVDFGFGPAFGATTTTDLDDAILRADELRNESLRARAFVEVGRTILQTLTATEQTKERLVRVGEDGMRRSALKSVMPAYPEDARKSGQQGVAVAEVQYNGKGNVTDAVIVEAPVSNVGDAVIRAVKQWKFKPSTLKGEPISVRGKLTFYFVIDKDGNGHVENPKQFQ